MGVGRHAIDCPMLFSTAELADPQGRTPAGPRPPARTAPNTQAAPGASRLRLYPFTASSSTSKISVEYAGIPVRLTPP
jgi:hypothetical protein